MQRESISGILQATAEWAGCEISDIIGKSKETRYVLARVIAIKKLKEAGLSYRDIGFLLGGRSHVGVRNLLIRWKEKTAGSESGREKEGKTYEEQGGHNDKNSNM